MTAVTTPVTGTRLVGDRSGVGGGGGPGLHQLERHGVPVEVDEGGVPAEGGQRGGLIGQRVEVAGLQGVELGDRPTEAIVDGGEVEPVRLPGLA